MDKIAFQGQLGAYSHLACTQVMPEAQPIPFESFVQALEAVESGQASVAMIPVENSTAGRVEEIYRQIPKTTLHIVAEHFQPVNHCLMAIPGAKPSWVMSHPQALAQCHDRILGQSLVPKAEFDTAGAAQLLRASGDLTGAAIASELAAKLYNLDVLQTHYEDIKGNTTRFICLSKEPQHREPEIGVQYISSILFSVRNIPAALYKALGGFATNGLNLIKIESHMDGKTLNSSQFHIDINDHVNSPSMKLAMDELKFYASELRWLGSYPAHEFRFKT